MIWGWFSLRDGLLLHLVFISRHFPLLFNCRFSFRFMKEPLSFVLMTIVFGFSQNSGCYVMSSIRFHYLSMELQSSTMRIDFVEMGSFRIA